MNQTRNASMLPALNLKDALLAIEKTLIHSVLIACDWNQRKAAQALGVLPTTLSEKIYRLELHPPGSRRSQPRRAGGDPLPAHGAAHASVPAIEIAAQVNGWCASCGQDTREA